MEEPQILGKELVGLQEHYRTAMNISLMNTLSPEDHSEVGVLHLLPSQMLSYLAVELLVD